MKRFRTKFEGLNQRRIVWVCKTCEAGHDKKLLGLTSRPTECMVCLAPREFYYFASRAECIRFGELRLLERLGKISALKVQTKFEIFGVRRQNKTSFVQKKYIADFTYMKNGQLVVEDVKGSEKGITDVSRGKIRDIERQEGFTVNIIIR